MIISAQILSAIGRYYTIWPCVKLAWTLNDRNKLMLRYPSCVSNPDRPTIVLVDFNDRAEEVGAALGLSFGMAGWVSLFMHLVGVEIYVSDFRFFVGCYIILMVKQLRLTPGESRRLRQVAYERQLKAGFRNPGNAGLTIDRFGDNDGVPLFTPERSANGQNEQIESRELEYSASKASHDIV
jgi:hypothetical protein